MRRLLPTIALALALANWSPAAESLTLHPNVQLQDFRSPGRVTLLRDGRLACVSKGRLLTTADRGRNWTAHAEIPAGPGPKIDGGMLVQDASGRLALVYRDDAGVHLERTADNMPLPGARLQVWCVRSDDGGKTWSGHQRLIHGYCGAIIDGIGTRDGSMVVPLQELRYNPPRHVTVVFSSSDGGEHWRRSRDLDIGGYGIEDGCFEPTVAQRGDGSILMLLRTTRNRIWRSESKDRGRTWSDPQATSLEASNSPSYLLSLASGRMALVWNPVGPTNGADWPRRVKPRYAEKPDSVYREELLLAISSDGGNTWTKPQVIARQPGAKLRYAYMFEQPEGGIWLALRGKWLTFRESDFAAR